MCEGRHLIVAPRDPRPIPNPLRRAKAVAGTVELLLVVFLYPAASPPIRAPPTPVSPVNRSTVVAPLPCNTVRVVERWWDIMTDAARRQPPVAGGVAPLFPGISIADHAWIADAFAAAAEWVAKHWAGQGGPEPW